MKTKHDGEGQLPALGSIPAHKSDPEDTSHLSDLRRKRYLQGPPTEVRDGGYPSKYGKKPPS